MSRVKVAPPKPPLATPEQKRAMRWHGIEFSTSTTQHEADILLAIAQNKSNENEDVSEDA